MVANSTITIELRREGKGLPVARLYVAEAVSGQLVLDTNQSLNALVEFGYFKGVCR